MITVDVYGPDFRKTDIAVAENVFGLKLRKQQGYSGYDPIPGWFLYDYDPQGSGPQGHTYLHLFETDIADAWLVVGKMQELGWRFSDQNEYPDRDVAFQAFFWKYLGEMLVSFSDGGPTAPAAICQAALKAVTS